MTKSASGPEGGTSAAIQRARIILARRQRRAAYFPASILGETGWDILLVLFAGIATDDEQIAAMLGGAPSTVARWIKHLADLNMVATETLDRDPGRFFVKLTVAGVDAMTRFIEDR